MKRTKKITRPTLATGVFVHCFILPKLLIAARGIYDTYGEPYPVEASFAGMVNDVLDRLQEVKEGLPTPLLFDGDPNELARWRGVCAAIGLIEAVRDMLNVTATGYCSKCHSVVPIAVEIEQSRLYSIASSGCTAKGGRNWRVRLACARCGGAVQTDGAVRHEVIETLRSILETVSSSEQSADRVDCCRDTAYGG
jgi:hypothetical protein